VNGEVWLTQYTLYNFGQQQPGYRTMRFITIMLFVPLQDFHQRKRPAERLACSYGYLNARTGNNPADFLQHKMPAATFEQSSFER